MWSQSFLSSFALFSMAVTTVLADSEFTPVTEDEMHDLLGMPQKRKAFDESLATDLKPQKSLYWAQKNGDQIQYANLTANMPEDTQFMLDTDDFKPMIKNMVCGQNINLEFNTRRQLEMARTKWDWVNDDDARQLALLTNWKGCGHPGRRQGFEVKSIQWDTEKNTAHIKSNQRKLSGILHTYSMDLDFAPIRQSKVRVRDDFSKSFDLSSSFNQDLFNHTFGGYYIAAACTDCGTSGSLNVKGKVDVGLTEINEAWIQLEAQDIGAWLGVWGSVGLGSVPGAGFSWRKNVFKFPLSTLSPIPEILQLGPYAAVDVGFKLGKVSGGMEMAAGARMDIADGAYAKMDFSDLDNVHGDAAGWDPEFTSTPISLDAHVTMHNEVYSILAVQMRAVIDLEIKEYGYVASLDLKLPYFGADITAATDQNNDVCGGAGNQEDAVSVVGNVGIGLSFEGAEVKDMADPLFQIPIYSTHWDLYSTCFEFGGSASHTFSNISTIPEPTQTMPGQPGNGTNGSVEARATPVAGLGARGYYKGRPVQW